MTGNVDADILVVILCRGKGAEDVSSNDGFGTVGRNVGGSDRRIDGREGESGRPVVGVAGVCRSGFRRCPGVLDFKIAKAHPDGGLLNVFLGRNSAGGARTPEAPNAVRTVPARSRSRTRHAFSLVAPRSTCRGIPPAGAAAVACRRAESGCRRRRLWIWMPPLRYARTGNGEFSENRKKQKRGTAHGKTRQYTA